MTVQQHRTSKGDTIWTGVQLDQHGRISEGDRAAMNAMEAAARRIGIDLHDSTVRRVLSAMDAAADRTTKPQSLQVSTSYSQPKPAEKPAEPKNWLASRLDDEPSFYSELTDADRQFNAAN